MNINELLKEKILILDGSMGVMLQRLNLNEADFRGERFKSHPVNLSGNNDILCLTQPEKVSEIHRNYLEAGADIIETNTFNAQALSQHEYGCEDLVEEINMRGAALARAEADRYMQAHPGEKKFVAGSVGPTAVSASLPADVNDPGARLTDHATLKAAYLSQMRALIRGGVDLLLIETVFDILNAKAAVSAAHEAMQAEGRELPVIVSATVSDTSGRLLSGQTVEAFMAAISYARPLAVGLNCSAGPQHLIPYLRRLSAVAPCATIIYPNAGLPDELGNYAQTPELFAEAMQEMAQQGLVNIAGGCCGTTPEHIALLREKLADIAPRTNYSDRRPAWLASMEAFSADSFINVGERCNVAGSRKFLRLIKEKNYSEAAAIARRQVESGAMVLDINMDDALLDAKAEMVHFLRILGSDPLTASVPWMIDSSDFGVIEAALGNLPGKGIVNSISLKKGEEEFLREARVIASYGAAVVVMAFDEQGQADTFERKCAICARAYSLLTEKAGFSPEDIIFDPNILTIATGMPEHDRYALDYLRAVEWIKNNLPGAKSSGGVSNLSFSFRGNNYLRQAMHASFLYHAVSKGLSMAIMDPGAKVTYSDIPADLLERIEDALLCRRADAAERLVDVASEYAAVKTGNQQEAAPAVDLRCVEERLADSLRRGDDSGLEVDLPEAVEKLGTAAAVVDGPLMQGMEIVGKLFETGKMFLPQVVKSARVMHRAVEILRPLLEAGAQKTARKGLFLLATVKGDVHDIGKNIAAVVLRCNGYEVVDLGVQVAPEKIAEEALRLKPDFIGLSGLITPSLQEMRLTAEALERAGVSVPLMVGGAATSALHTALSIAPAYSGAVVRVNDAAQNPLIAARFAADAVAEKAAADSAHHALVKQHEAKKGERICSPQSMARPVYDWSKPEMIAPAPAQCGEIITLDSIPVADVRPYINFTYFFNCWKVRPGSAQAEELLAEANSLLDRMEDEGDCTLAQTAFYSACGRGEEILLNTEKGEVVIPTPRQKPGCHRRELLALADFVAPQGGNDHIGCFCATIGEGIRQKIASAARQKDDYALLLLQSVADRLAEATSEYLHRLVRHKLWGYSAEDESMQQIRQGKYQGIRPAVGYPSLPDQKLMHTLMGKLLAPERLGLHVTENGALDPASSVAGIYIASPVACYFSVESCC